MAKIPLVSPINPELILERIRFENLWWVSGSIDPEFDAMKRRSSFSDFYDLIRTVDVRRGVLLMGQRRVGKTVMLFHSIAKLLEEGENKLKICFVSLDNPVYAGLSLEKLFELARYASGSPDPASWFLFFDEIQYLRNWEQHLKTLVDSYPNTKFIASGSASAALKYRSLESGAGRLTEFILSSVSFYEYVSFTGNEHIMRRTNVLWKGNLDSFVDTSNIKELNRLFIEYINFGGYPETIFSDSVRKNPGRYIKFDILDKVLLRDLPGLYGIRDIQELNSFFTVLAYNSGKEISLEALSKSCGIEKRLIKKYIEYLEASFLIYPLERVDNTARRMNRVTFYKIYITNPSLRSALFAPVESTDSQTGNMVETAIICQIKKPFNYFPRYARWNIGGLQGEVDLVGLSQANLGAEWAIEIKFTNRFFESPRELKSLLKFCRENGLKNAAVTTFDKTGECEVDGITLHFFPSSLYAYALGIKDPK